MVEMFGLVTVIIVPGGLIVFGLQYLISHIWELVKYV